MKKALVLALTFVLGLGIAAFAGPLSGSWGTDIELTINPSGGAITVSDFDSTLIVDYTVGGWTFESESGFDLNGWSTQSFSADGVLGAFTIGSDLVFSPSGASFTSWDTTGSVSIAGVSLDGEFLLTDNASGWTFGASGGAGDLSLSATVYLNMDSDGNIVQTGSYCFCFTSVDFDISFPFACIDLVDISLGFSSTGFDGVTFSASGIAVPGIAWLTFDADLTFDDGETGKSLTLTPAISLGDFTCIELYYELIYEGTTGYKIEGIDFYGIALEYTWNGVSFSSASSFDADYNEDITGNAAYWEVFTIASTADSCCGGGFDFSVATYFDNDSTKLFDWGESDIDVSVGMGSNFSVSAGLVVDTTGFTELTVGFDVTW
jgi:hypothetical protein